MVKSSKDNSKMDKNPLNDTMNLYALNMLTIKSLIALN